MWKDTLTSIVFVFFLNASYLLLVCCDLDTDLLAGWPSRSETAQRAFRAGVPLQALGI